MQYLVNPSIPLESDPHQVVESMQSSINPTLHLESELYASHVFFNVSSELSRKGGTKFSFNEPPPSPRIASFDWDSLVEAFLPLDTPFQIKVKVEPYTIARCIVDEGALVSILSACAWQGMGSPSLVSTAS